MDRSKTRLNRELETELLNEFLLMKRSEGRAELTLRDYRRHVSTFLDRYRDEEDYRFAAYDYLSDSISPSTYNLRLTYLKAFFDWVVDEGHLEKNPFRGMKRKRTEGRFRLIDEAVISTFISCIDRSDPLEFRDYCLVLLILDCGIRPGEALGLDCQDVDLEGGTVKVREEIAKTRRQRTLPVSSQVLSGLSLLIGGRMGPVFQSRGLRRLSGGALCKRFEMYSKRAGVTLTPYDLRHASATLHLKGGMNVLSLQRLLGHSTPIMTSRYVHLSVEDLRIEAAGASPTGRLIESSRPKRPAWKGRR